MILQQNKLSTEIESVISNIYFINPSDQPVGIESTTIYHMFFAY